VLRKELRLFNIGHLILKQIKVACPGSDPLRFLATRLHDGYDRVLQSNGGGTSPDVLLFLDSRGISKQFEQSLADRLIQLMESKAQTFLLICRPLELTTWATLYNFMKINSIRPSLLITNMGFVDFTPKKQSILEGSIQQIEAVMGVNMAQVVFVEEHFLSTVDVIPLFSMKYEKPYRSHIESIVARQSTLIINTPLVKRNIAIERVRPSSFFDSLERTKQFNESISGAQIIDIPLFDETMTYDAVHYTNLGNEVIFDLIAPKI
jgi:hypothetical protein